jgi:putative flippase GtrA
LPRIFRNRKLCSRDGRWRKAAGRHYACSIARRLVPWLGEMRWRERLGALFARRSFGRFLVVGGLNTVVGYGGFPVLYLSIGDRVGYLPILVFCYVFNPAFSFLTHKYITFNAHGPARSEIGRYVLFWVCAFLASWGFLALIHGWNRIWFVLAQVGFSIGLTVVNFFIVRRFVFAPISNNQCVP